MSEIYSLDSPEFKAIEIGVSEFLAKFYSNKRCVPFSPVRRSLLEKFKEDFPTNFKRFLHEYDMGFMERGGKFIITSELNSIIQQYIIYVSKFQCASGKNLKPAYTIQGKNAEAVAMLAINNFLHYWNVKNQININTKSFRYGGDGGYDFSLGKFRFDVKHRDDGPNHGLILRDHFLERSDQDDVILIFATNASNIKLGSGHSRKAFDLPFKDVVKHLNEQVLPMALSGWITIGDFKKKRQSRGGEEDGVWVVDNLNPISDLFIMILEDQIDSEEWFV